MGSGEGDPKHQESSQQEMKGAGTVHFNEKLADQKPDTQTGPAKAFNKTQLGSGELILDMGKILAGEQNADFATEKGK
jgi:hypothetical protein